MVTSTARHSDRRALHTSLHCACRGAGGVRSDWTGQLGQHRALYYGRRTRPTVPVACSAAAPAADAGLTAPEGAWPGPRARAAPALSPSAPGCSVAMSVRQRLQAQTEQRVHSKTEQRIHSKTEQRVHSKTDRATSSQQDRQSNEFTARQSNEFTAKQTEQRVHSKDRQSNEFTARQTEQRVHSKTDRATS